MNILTEMLCIRLGYLRESYRGEKDWHRKSKIEDQISNIENVLIDCGVLAEEQRMEPATTLLSYITKHPKIRRND